ncbi:MAG TPA: tryptophan--tRNA ligase [Patescibacteria group bacterium]|nr:tryptophan--tRNA ligase [Patescibacteria group bacterium]
MKKRLFSGIQPTGNLHLGNYLGAIQQWVAMQHEYESIFCIVDLHAITVRQDPAVLRENIRRIAAIYLACGLDPKESTIFVQSRVPEHTQLGWILNTFTQMGELERMTQFKDKAKQHSDNINAGLFDYPVLMAADILLYETQAVPVGEDQKQHVELTRNIAQRFNNHYKKNVFVIPEYVSRKETTRIMGLDNPEKKMSKSAASEFNYVSFFDTPDMIRKKIKRAVTDSGSEIRAGEDKPALTNLLTIYSALSGKTIAELEQQYEGKGYGDFKTDLGEVVVQWMEPTQKKMAELLQDTAELDRILDEGAKKAQSIATETLKKVNTVVGLGY